MADTDIIEKNNQHAAGIHRVLDAHFVQNAQAFDSSPDVDETKVVFLSYYLPAITSGTYTLTVQQSVNVPGYAEEKTGKLTKAFRVEGPRFEILLTDIAAVFPPQNTEGDYHQVFPHIAFKRKSLPWEVDMDTPKDPWLALVLFHGDEAPSIKEQKIGKLENIKNAATHQEEFVNVIEISNPALQPHQPAWQAHVRQAQQQDRIISEMAFLVANRLPKPEVKNTVHLVSLADRPGKNQFISLHHWEFKCGAVKDDFMHVMQNLEVKPFRFYAVNQQNEFQNFKIHQEGYVALPHFLRQGVQTLSLYQSPLLPYQGPALIEASIFSRSIPIPKPKLSYDRVEWKTIDEQQKIPDVTFATAFHLGRMLTVANKQVAQAVFKWKCQMYQQQKQEYLLEETKKTIPDVLRKDSKNDLPPLITAWIASLLTLQKIPFNYIVPYEQLLAPNTFRFFKLHKKWLKNCLDGMLTIGEEFFQFESEEVLYNGAYTGFIMRAPIVGQYPDLEVNAFNHKKEKVDIFFKRALSTEVLICCFKDEVVNVEVFLPARAIHFDHTLNDEEGKTVKGNEYQVVDFSTLANSSAELAEKLMARSPKVHFLVGDES